MPREHRQPAQTLPVMQFLQKPVLRMPVSQTPHRRMSLMPMRVMPMMRTPRVVTPMVLTAMLLTRQRGAPMCPGPPRRAMPTLCAATWDGRRPSGTGMAG
ncbi:MAG: hypothetical protein D8H96_11315 [Lautropia sp.]|nr:MAG: hypothetical protein D8H96_11315 [Lautropia sp.]